MNQVMLIIRAMFSRRWLPATMIVIVAMLLMIRLGIWQLDRLEQRRAENAVLMAVLEADPLLLTGEPLPEDLESLADRQIVAEGAFDYNRELVLLVQNWSGRAGVHLLTPFIFEGGDTAVLVDRGWVPQADYETDALAQYEAPAEGSLNGYLALSQTLGNRQAETTAEVQTAVYRVDVSQIAGQLPYDLLPMYVIQAPDDNSRPPFREAPEIDLSEGPHLSYALQWFSFSVIVAVGYCVLLYKRSTAEAESGVDDKV